MRALPKTPVRSSAAPAARTVAARRLAPLVLSTCLAACSSTHWYVVRHAEKQDQSADPPLSDAGRRRAQALAAELSGAGIDRIFVSDKRRTQETAAPSATAFGLVPTVVPAAETAALAERLKATSGEDVLVVRHSNELHVLVNALSPADTIAPIGDDEFDNLFVVTKRVFLWQTDVRLDRRKYGEPSPPTH